MTRSPLLALLLLAAACRKDDGTPDTGALDADGDGVLDTQDCDDDDPTVGGGATWYLDGDGDGYGTPDDPVVSCGVPSGYATNADDCDDTLATVHPGAAEPDCTDPTDYNCDGSVGFADADADGYPACEDCDDADANVNPGAPEICDGADQDCDGVADEDATDAPTWYGDSDGDGYGGTRFTEAACEAPEGFVADSADCDDLDPSSYPGAPELCDEADNNCDGTVDEEVESTWWKDEDGDGFGDVDFTLQACTLPAGYADNPDDCDDADATAHPDGEEICDGADNNCDGQADEGDAADASTWYADRDADGHGDPGLSARACETPTGYVSTALDCDDGDAGVSPDAPEICDGADNNCDGDTDEDGAADASTWHRDGDGDGYGDPSRTDTACEAPSGYVADDQDCDDGDRRVNPAASEICDGADNDCDGLSDDDDPDLDPSTGTTWYTDGDGDSYGGSSSTLACTQPAGTSASADDCDDSDAAVNPGAAEVVDGVDTNCDGLGYHGVYSASSSTTLAGGVWEFTSFTVASGVTITVTGTDPLEVYVLGAAELRGTVDLSGEDGTNLGPFSYTPNAGGGGGGGGGGDGGYGSSYYVHGYPYGAAGAGSGDSPGQGGLGYSAGSGGGGGGNLGAGDAGQDAGGCYTAIAGGLGGASVNSSTSPVLQAGSGGGGGGYGTGYNSDGAGGGGGGGAFYLEAATVTLSGAVRCFGGDGGGTSGTAYHAAAGGGGSGGTFWVVADTLTLTGSASCDGGQGGTAYEGGHCGTAGDGGDGADGLIYLDATSTSVTGTVSPTWYKP